MTVCFIDSFCQSKKLCGIILKSFWSCSKANFKRSLSREELNILTNNFRNFKTNSVVSIFEMLQKTNCRLAVDIPCHLVYLNCNFWSDVSVFFDLTCLTWTGCNLWVGSSQLLLT